MRLPDGLTTRALRPDDAAEVCALMEAAETADVGEPFIDLADLVGHWRRPELRPGHAGGGRGRRPLTGGPLVGYAEVSGGRYADVVVPPDHRGRGIGTALARWTQDEARRQGGTQVGMAVPLGSPGDALLTALGYRVAWTSWILELPEGSAVVPQALPDGFSVRGMRLPAPAARRTSGRHTGWWRTRSGSGPTASPRRSRTGRRAPSGGPAPTRTTCAWRSTPRAPSSG